MTADPSNVRRLPAVVQRALETDLTIDITTVGRTSGELRRVEIWFLMVDGAVYITGTPGPRDWFANLIADPTLTFHLKESVETDLPARATVVEDPLERRLVFESGPAAWYRDQTPTEELIATAPMVRLFFETRAVR